MLLSEISGSTERVPSEREIWQHLMPAWKRNALATSFEFHLILQSSMQKFSLPRSLSRQEIRASLKEIAKRPPVFSLFVEDDAPNQLNPDGKTGCFVIGHTRLSGEPGYYAAIISDNDLQRWGFVSIAPSKHVPDSRIAQFSSDGWQELSIARAAAEAASSIAVTAIRKYRTQGLIKLPLQEIKTSKEDEAPFDSECMRRLQLVLTDKMPLARGSVSRSRIRPFDPHFANSIPREKVMAILEYANHGLLVYWDGEYFVSSDDYYGYLGCEVLGIDEVNVVIMGDFPKGIAKIERRGNQKLLPPPLVVSEGVTPGVTKEFEAWQTRELLRRQQKVESPADLLAMWIAFADLLGEDDPTERAVHELLKAHPTIMGSQWDSTESEVWFGRFKADFVLRANRALPAVRLVELERPNHRLFTKDLHETDEVTHAVQQVNDWIRYCRQNPQDLVIASSNGVAPDGLVVIGRSRYLSKKEREVLAHNNQGRDVKVITYDELLDDFGSLILPRLDDGSPDKI